MTETTERKSVFSKVADVHLGRLGTVRDLWPFAAYIGAVGSIVAGVTWRKRIITQREAKQEAAVLDEILGTVLADYDNYHR
jgi:hypothetical protein